MGHIASYPWVHSWHKDYLIASKVHIYYKGTQSWSFLLHFYSIYQYIPRLRGFMRYS